MDARGTGDGRGARSPRRATVSIVVLLALLVGSVTFASSATAASSATVVYNGATISIRSGDKCSLKAAPPTTGRRLIRNFVCSPVKKPGVPPAVPYAPRIKVMYTNDTFSLQSGDGCVLKTAAPKTGRKLVRNFTCTMKSQPPPPPPGIPDPPVTPGGTSGLAGTTVGTAQYAVPAGAIIVSPTGNNAAAGTQAAPLQTLNGAVARAGSGATIVLRAGTYHESVVIPPDKRLAVQAWPGEAVWLDGSSPVTGWAASGARWVKTGWTLKFDHSPTYTRGAPDNGGDWGFIDPSYPMAAHPDQIWIDGAAQRQVATLAQVGPGTFFHDETANQLWLGTDPTGKGVRASTLQTALMVRSAGSSLRGFGVRRYAPSVPDMGAVTLEEPNILAENLVVSDNSTTGIEVGSGTTPGVVLRNLYVARNGMLGISGNYADNLTIDKVLSEYNNTERFNQAPVSGGAKITRSRGIAVWHSVFRGNYGPGLWMDESDYNITIQGNEMRNNYGHGTSLEISAAATFANNIVTGNGGFGIKINNTANVSVWNNTFVGNDRSINLVQDDRLPSTANTAGRDKRQPFPDPTMTWLNGNAVIANNIVASQKSGICMICVEDYSHVRSAEQMVVTTNSNVYQRPNASLPTYLVVWSRGPGDPWAFASFSDVRNVIHQEAQGQIINSAGYVDATGKVIGSISNTATPIPANIATITGVAAGTKYHGAWPR
jgi:parallel beta-helix repeat protein